MDRKLTGLVIGALLASAVPAAAQELEKVCGSLSGVEQGDWAAFRMEGAQAANVSAVRFAFVNRGDRAEPWFEVNATTPQGNQIVQLQVSDFPFGPGEVGAGILKTGAMPAMRVPEQMLAMLRQQMSANPVLDIRKQCLQAEIVGEETVDAGSGNVKAWHLRAAGGNDIWVSSEVPFGVVRGAAGDGSGTMILEDFGGGATSSIPEEPQDMPSLPGMTPQD